MIQRWTPSFHMKWMWFASSKRMLQTITYHRNLDEQTLKKRTFHHHHHHHHHHPHHHPSSSIIITIIIIIIILIITIIIIIMIIASPLLLPCFSRCDVDRRNSPVCFLKEGIVAMPYYFLRNLSDDAPTVARPLKKVDPGKAKKYLELAEILVNRFASVTNARSVQFLVDLCTNRNPGPLAPIPWYTNSAQQDQIVIRQPDRILARVAPTIRFEARIVARRWEVKTSEFWLKFSTKSWAMGGREFVWSLANGFVLMRFRISRF